METRCQRCGTPATSGQAFCVKCGAVIGMVDAGGDDASLNLAATMVGSKLPAAPPPRPAPRPPAARPAAPPAPAASPSRGGRTLLLAVVGFMLVLLVGSLFILLFMFGTD